MLVCKIRLTNNIIQHTKVSIFKDDRCVKMAYNVSGIAEGGDFQHKIQSKNEC